MQLPIREGVRSLEDLLVRLFFVEQGIVTVGDRHATPSEPQEEARLIVGVNSNMIADNDLVQLGTMSPHQSLAQGWA